MKQGQLLVHNSKRGTTGEKQISQGEGQEDKKGKNVYHALLGLGHHLAPND